MTETKPALEVRNLNVARGGRQNLDNVSVTVAPGEIVVVVGPNGAGKTTLLDTIVGAVPAKAGGCFVGGQPLGGLFGGLRDRSRWLGYLAGEAEPPPEARVRVLLDDAAGKSDDRWIGTLEARLGLGDLRGAVVGTLSRGERRRVLLFEALARGKPFLLLDEPTGVFDPLQLLDIIALLREAAERGAGLLVTVHQMSDAEALGSRILVLDDGHTVGLGTMSDLRMQAAVSGTASLQETFLALLRAKHPIQGSRT